MKRYIVPNMEIISLETEDVITTSGCSGGAGTPFDRWCVNGMSGQDIEICYDDIECTGWGDIEVD